MNNRGGQPPATGDHQSPLSLLVSAADSRGDRGQGGQGGGGGGGGAEQQQGGGASLFAAEALRRGLIGGAQQDGGGGGLSLEEQYLLQQQLQGHLAQQGHGHGGLLGHLAAQRDHQGLTLSSLGQQQQQIANLLGLTGGGGGGSSDVHAALAHQLRQQQQQQQQQQFTQADLLALSRTGAFSGLSGLMGGGGGLGGGGFGGFGGHFGGLGASELEGIQRLDEFERRSRLYGAAAAAAGIQAPPVPGRTASSALAAAAAAGVDMRGDSSERSFDRPPLPGAKVKQSEAERRSSAARGESTSAKAVKAKSGVPNAAAAHAAAVAHAHVTHAHAAHAGDDAYNKDELEKAPGSVIVPCRARGMPMDHNFKTAYFVIPENVKHGEELICSYFACRNAGIKFRYCSHCKVPVAKRNFRKRHKHGGEDIAKIAGEDSDGEEEEICRPAAPIKSNNNKGIPSQITANRKELLEVEADGISSQSTDNSKPKKSNQEVQKGLVRKTFETISKNTAAAAAAGASNGAARSAAGGDGKITADRRKRWTELLDKRPSTKQGDSMSTWLMAVLAVSDLETPLVPGDAAVSGTSLVSADEANKNAAAAAVIMNNKKSPMKERGAGRDDSPRSDKGYGSSTDDSNGNGKKEKPSGSPSLPTSGVVKKKRPAEKDDEGSGAGGQASEFFVSGSFAAWKERKKAKKQAKMNAQTSV